MNTTYIVQHTAIGVNLVKLLGGAPSLYNLELKQYGRRRRPYRAAEGGLIEPPKAALSSRLQRRGGRGMGEGCPLPYGVEVWGRGTPCPTEKFLI